MSKSIFVKNLALPPNEKEVKKLRHLKYSDWQPEYERLGIEPTAKSDVSKDFDMYSKRKDVSATKPKKDEEKAESKASFHKATRISVGAQQDHLWNAIDDHGEVILAEDVPSPPKSPFSHNESQAEQNETEINDPAEELENELDSISLTEAQIGEYCVMIDDNFILKSQDVRFIEDMLNQIVINEKDSSILDRISIFKKINLEFGVHLDE